MRSDFTIAPRGWLVAFVIAGLLWGVLCLGVLVLVNLL